MAKIDTSFNNFARGQIDHDMMGRYDLPIYTSGADIVENFITNFKGNAIYRTGFETIFLFQDCAFVEFKFNKEQQYICVFFNLKVRFLSYASDGTFGWVESSPSVILEVTTPYDLAESKELDTAQKDDVMYVVHELFAPRKLTRVSATSFTVATYSRTVDPFTGSGLFPSVVAFHKNRLWFAAPTTKITTLYATVLGAFDDHTLVTISATTAIEVTLADISQKIEWLFSGENSLIVGSSDAIVTVNGGVAGVAITAGIIDPSLTTAEPCNSAKPFRKDGLIFYMSVDGRSMQFFEFDLLKEAFISDDANFISYDITAGGITKLRWKKDKNDLIFGVNAGADGDLISCNFNKKEKVIGWHANKTEGQFLDTAVITDNSGKQQLFALSLRNSAYYIERQGEYNEFKNRAQFFTGKTAANKAADNVAYARFVAEQMKECIHLDQALTVNNLQEQLGTYDSGAGTFTDTDGIFVSGDVGKHIVYKTITGYESGRLEITARNSSTEVDVDVLQTPTSATSSTWYLTFSSISGLSDYNGTTVGIVTDGGFLNDFAISGGVQALGKQVTHAVVGYRYKGIIKSFSLGFQIQGLNTQRMMKAISEFGVRCVNTAGLEVGSSLYSLEAVQELTQDDVNYLPAMPIDGTKFVSLSDDNEQDKFFYLVQDVPLPAVVTTAIITANYTIA